MIATALIAEGLAAWAVGPVDPPVAVRAAAARHLLDAVGTAIGGLRSGTVAAAVEVARGLGGPPEASLFGTTERLGAPAAALATGALTHALDFDDTHAGGLVHATSVVLPAAVAVGQQVGASGKDVLTAAVVGLETVCRVAAAAPHGFHARGLHATMVGGVFSSAIVTARLLGLSASATTNALGIAGSQAGGLLAFLSTGASTKQLHPGFASQSGIIAARLAAAGATGPATVFDGPHGVFDALATGSVRKGSVVEGLGQRWETTRIGIKPYPACQLAHAAIDATRVAVRGLAAGEVVSIDVDVHPDSAPTVCDDSRDLTRPASPYAAKFSLPWSVSATVLDGDLTTRTYEAIDRPEVSSLARRVTWTVTPTGGPAADAPGVARVTLRDGRVVTGTVPRSAGGPDDPLSDAALDAKFLGNAGASAGSIVKLVRGLDEQDSLEPLLAAVASVGGRA
jgi:2-methylcitrate dehydratase PrpD